MRALLFDMDGVLIRSAGTWFRLAEEAGRRFRGHPVTRAEFAESFGQDSAADVKTFGLRCSAGELDAFYLEAFGDHAAEALIDPEAEPLLRDLRSSGIRTAVVTNTATPLAEQLLATAGLRPYLDHLLGADLVRWGKPAPDLLLLAMQRLGVSSEQCALVGDSRFDLEAARAAEVHFIGFGIEGDARIDALSELRGKTLPSRREVRARR